MHVERFGVSANNVTYALLGETLRYWDFFPASEDGWGRIPAWGYARVVAGNGVDGLAVGDRLYGYVPMSSHLHLTPGPVRGDYLRDVSPHRLGLPPAYNAYQVVDERSEREEDVTLLLRPLFTLAWLLADDLVSTEPNGGRVVITSASSKTALALAYLLRAHGVPTVGVTSPAKVDFVAGSGLFDRTAAYDEITATGSDEVLVDIAGAPHLRPRFPRSVLVGMTHGDAAAMEASDTDSVVFSAVDRIAARSREWGGRELRQRMDASWTDFLEHATGWIRIRRASGAEAALEVWRSVVAGAAPADIGNVLTL
ncbi:DUF2855 family protein [Pseudonocardia eucalypti]|uniref:DUF2855 family protein n=1 Tax=Pseudonocardia eucalypti TaxID=648755 RepID=A0ABP9PP75_9PSEU